MMMTSIAHLDRPEELPGPVPDQPHHDLLVALVVAAVGLVAQGDVPGDDAARSSDADQLCKCPRRYQALNKNKTFIIKAAVRSFFHLDLMTDNIRLLMQQKPKPKVFLA